MPSKALSTPAICLPLFRRSFAAALSSFFRARGVHLVGEELHLAQDPVFEGGTFDVVGIVRGGVVLVGLFLLVALALFSVSSFMSGCLPPYLPLLLVGDRRGAATAPQHSLRSTSPASSALPVRQHSIPLPVPLPVSPSLLTRSQHVQPARPPASPNFLNSTCPPTQPRPIAPRCSCCTFARRRHPPKSSISTRSCLISAVLAHLERPS